MFKSTFKSDSNESKSRKESLESNNENKETGSSKKGEFIDQIDTYQRLCIDLCVN